MKTRRVVAMGSVGVGALLGLAMAPRAATPVAQVDEVRFWEERVALRPGSGMTRAALASACLERARATRQESWRDRAEAEARRSLELLPVGNAAAHALLAALAEMRHDFAAAEREARIALEVDAGCEPARAVLLTTLIALGRTDEAERGTAELAARLPTPGALVLRALALEQQGKDEAARAALERARSAEDEETAAWALAVLARLHLRHGRLSEARALADEALARRPGHLQALAQLAEVEARSGRAELARRLALQGDHSLQVQVAGVLARVGQRDLAAGLWERAEAALRFQVARGQVDHGGLLARLLLDRGRSREAHEALALARQEAATRRDPRTWWTLARALAATARYEEAREAMGRALASGWRDAALLEDAAAIEAWLGNEEEARALLTQARALEGDASRS